ncbi:carbon-nitrogen family hydrolase [Konateibacter massiliensis]|uniref:carbon-nitrogen family hydrolase n=1 Tax=Konateibacter massiliensis TaxID=2002841 RepID=UPI000C15F0F4|nr:carbon-nitrogen family hydrolase [Konateibacter massiliensis]
MKIGLAQTDIIWENKEANYNKAELFIKEAAASGIEYLLFPEMSFTGFSMNTDKIGEMSAKKTTIEQFSSFSRKYKLYLGIGYVEKRENNSLNRFAVIDPSGKVIADYAKIHPFSYGEESLYYVGGEEIQYATIENMMTAPFICYDLRFPEIFQQASKTAQLITVAANWPKERRAHWLALLKARAIENQCYIAGVNRVGQGNGVEYSGDSLIISPYGEVLAELGNEEGIISAEIDQAVAEEYRRHFKLKKDRREELYGRFFQSPV